VRFHAAVVERAEPFVKRQQQHPVVHLEVPVMQVVEVVAPVNVRALGDDEAIEAGVRGRGRDHQVNAAERDDERRAGQQQEHERQRQIQDVLAGMHRDPRPRAGVHVAVMERMEPSIQRVEVQQSMIEIEVHGFHPEHRKRHRRDRPQRFELWDRLGGVEAEHDRLIERCDASTADEGEEHVVAGLVVEQE